MQRAGFNHKPTPMRLRQWWLIVLWSLPALAQDDQLDELDEAFRRAKTIQACRATWKATRAAGLPTAWLRFKSSEYSDCARRVMNARLDRVLVPLKKADPTQFKAGMALQRQFNDAVGAYCGRWDTWYGRCCSTCSFHESEECRADFSAARVHLLELTALPAPGATHERVVSLFTGFAQAWCASSPLAGDQCVESVLTLISAAQHDPGQTLACPQSP